MGLPITQGANNTNLSDLAEKTRGRAETIGQKIQKKHGDGLVGARALLNSLHFDSLRYDIARAGRYKFDKKLTLSDRAVGRTDKRTR